MFRNPFCVVCVFSECFVLLEHAIECADILFPAFSWDLMCTTLAGYRLDEEGRGIGKMQLCNYKYWSRTGLDKYLASIIQLLNVY